MGNKLESIDDELHEQINSKFSRHLYPKLQHQLNIILYDRLDKKLFSQLYIYLYGQLEIATNAQNDYTITQLQNRC